MKPIYRDYAPRWVPFVAAVLIVAGVWIGGVWANFPFADVTRLAVGLACVLFVLIFFQGRYFWKGQVDRLIGDGEYFEATTSMWIGQGKRVAFGPHETSKWTVKATGGQKPELSAVRFVAKGQTLEMSLVNPKLLDLQALSAINPLYFARLKADYPQLKSVTG